MRTRGKLFGWTLPMLALAVVVAGEIAAIANGVHRTRREERRHREQTAEWRKLARLTPPPRRETVAALETALDEARSRVMTFEAALRRAEEAAATRQASAAPDRAEDFFARAKLVERLRNRLRTAGVVFKPDENFGAVPREGRGGAGLERAVVEVVVMGLAEAAPAELLSVELPATQAALDRRTEESRERVRGAVWVRFVGRTESLRGLLNAIAAADLPLMVRRVDVEPATTEHGTGEPGREGRDATGTAGSRFSVVIEWSEAPRSQTDAA